MVFFRVSDDQKVIRILRFVTARAADLADLSKSLLRV